MGLKIELDRFSLTADAPGGSEPGIFLDMITVPFNASLLGLLCERAWFSVSRHSREPTVKS